ncbi:MAG TPA: 3D domain-containing protein [Pyrinomonadaceae bacterium]|nr:3D domain-containing protein [Pyrinomonadaceae bacterium]
MKKSTFLGSTLGVLLLFSIISYSQVLTQQQNQKSTQTVTQIAATSAAETPTDFTTSTSTKPAPLSDEKSAPAEIYQATAYSLHGRTASGASPSQGMIAADPRLLPIGSRVRIEAGSYSGEYVVADTGGAVRGKRIDIWTPSSREAMRFGRRTVKLTVLHLAGQRGTASSRPRTIKATQTAPGNATTSGSQKQ